MEHVQDLLKTREHYLKTLEKEKQMSLRNIPEGSLRIDATGPQPQYYHRTNPKDFNGTYIDQKNIDFVHTLAQKNYDQKTLHSIQKELKAIQKYFSTYPEINAEEIYETLHPARQSLVKPILEPLEQYIQNWISYEYQGNSFDESTPELYTDKGERVRSKSEWIIANLLMKEEIPYRYECPIYLKGLGKVYPDFTILNVRLRKEIYWEHFGMMDEPYYAENAIRRISAYERTGIFPGENLIITYETNKTPLSQNLLTLMIERYLK